MQLKLNNNLIEVQRVRLAVEEYCQHLDVSDKTIHRITLAMEELITNTVNYGYTDTAPHFIDLTLQQRENCLVIDIIDDAGGFDPRESQSGSLQGALQDRPIGGLGLHLLTYLSDDIGHRHLTPGNHTTLTFII